MKSVPPDNQPSGDAPRKLFYRIQEVAKMTGLKPYVLRYWESEFTELEPEKDASEQRRYRPSDIEVILAIRKLLYEDRFTIQGARKRLRAEIQKMREGGAAELASEVAATIEIPARIAAPTAATVAASAPEAPGPPRLGSSLSRLRLEVSELINMLS